jgi:hypothetical protein
MREKSSNEVVSIEGRVAGKAATFFDNLWRGYLGT